MLVLCCIVVVGMVIRLILVCRFGWVSWWCKCLIFLCLLCVLCCLNGYCCVCMMVNVCRWCFLVGVVGDLLVILWRLVMLFIVSCVWRWCWWLIWWCIWMLVCKGLSLGRWCGLV